MIVAPDLPLWAALVTAVLLLAGAAMTLLGSIGLLRLKTFYERAHAPTLGTTAGMTLTLLASIVGLSVLQGRPVLHVVLIALFITVTAPVTLTLLVQAAVFRDPAAPRDTVATDVPTPDDADVAP